MLEKAGHERFGLVRNPFQDLASETLAGAEYLHVDQEADTALKTIKEDVLEKRRKALVALVGPLGVGKTQRLVVATDEGRRLGAMTVHRQISADADVLVQGLAKDLREAATLGTLAKHLVQPKWYRDLQSLERKARKGFDPDDAGAVLAEALNANAPAFVLLNDLQNLNAAEGTERFFQALYAMANRLQPGVLVMFSSYPEYFAALRRNQAALAARIDRVFPIGMLSDDEAALLLAKRMPEHRIVEGLDPLYPFDRAAVASMNRAAQGNPRRLLKLADLVLERAVQDRAYHVGEKTVQEVIGSSDVVKGWGRKTAPRRLRVMRDGPKA